MKIILRTWQFVLKRAESKKRRKLKKIRFKNVNQIFSCSKNLRFHLPMNNCNRYYH